MNFTKLSLAAIMALGLSSAAMADVDVQFGGQAVLYYQTINKDSADIDLFDKAGAKGNVGLEIKSKADLGNGFSAGVTADVIGTAGLEGNLVNGVMQYAQDSNGDLGGYWISEAYVAKTAGNTTLKIGRQYLNTPLAFSEGWNVFKNSFEAAILVNKDIPNTVAVLGMVNKANHNGLGAEMSTFSAVNPAGGSDNAVYVLGLINNSIANLTADIWAYNLTSLATAVWGDLTYKVDGAGVPLTLAAHAANINPSADALNDTTMWGVKVATNIQGWGLSAAYDDVDDGAVSVQEVGGVKTKLFVQQILNQTSIAKDASTWQLKVVTPEFYGAKLVAQWASTDAGDLNQAGADNDLDELDLIVKTKVLGTNVLVAYVTKDYENDNMDMDLFRVVARYNF